MVFHEQTKYYFINEGFDVLATISKSSTEKKKNMRISIVLSLLIFLSLPKYAESQTDSVAMSSNVFSFYGNFPESFVSWADSEWRGINYVISGFLYPGDYFDENCPDQYDCGITIDTVYDSNGQILSLVINPQDPTIVIGDWDCRSFIIGGNDIGATGQDEAVRDIACQTFNFYPHDLSPCPEGCYVVTEGLLDQIETNEGKGIRIIAGGTDEFKSIRGKIVPNYVGFNSTGFDNTKFLFDYDFVDQENAVELPLDVSIKNQSLIFDGPIDSLTGLPAFGAVIILEGVIYQGGTLATNGLNSGVNASGNAEWDSIGIWTVRGTWATEGHNLDEGLFLVNKQYFEFDHPDFGPVQFITDSEGDATLGVPLKQVVLGATGSLMGQTGESTQTIIGQNASGGWNLSYTFETSGLTDTKDLPEEPTLSLQLYPNPTADQLTVKLENIQDFGVYTLEVTNMAGQRVLFREFDLRSGTFIWNTDVSAFTSGWYGLVVKRDGKVVGSTGFAKVE